MTTLIYVLGDYEESGTRNVAATLDPGKLRGMVERYHAEALANWLKDPLTHLSSEASKTAARNEYSRNSARYLAGDIAGLQALMDAGLHNLIGEASGTDLDRRAGWGGLQLHVVALE